MNGLNLVYDEFLSFLECKGLDLDKYKLQEGYYWIDRMIIRAFDIQGNEYKIVRIHVDTDFKITFTDYVNEDFEIATWQDLVELNRDRLKKLENDSMRDVRDLMNKYSNSQKYICHSGGKDSTVLNHVVRKVDSTIPILFNNTSNESADTYKLIKSLNNVKILNPKEGFWQYMKRENFIPSRIRRSCCGIYKHDLTLDNLNQDEKHLLFMGVRNSESRNRAGYQTDHRFDYYPENWAVGLGIREWTEMDIWLYILMEGLKINNIYKYGYGRCGCVICGYRSNLEELMTKHFFPTFVDRFEKIQRDYFISRDRWIGLNCTIDEFINKGAWKGGLHRPEPNDEVVKEFATYKGLSEEVALKYFNKTCKECGKSIRQNDVIAMNLKYLGRGTDGILCKKHMKEYLSELQGGDFSNKQWSKTIEDFKDDGCELF